MTSFWTKKRVLITGHEGFLGSWLTKTLVEQGANVTGVDIVLNRKVSMLTPVRKRYAAVKADVADYAALRRAAGRCRPQFIFHLAAQAIVQEANQDPVRTFKSNIQGTWNLLEIARHSSSVEAVVVASSDKAYGEHKKLPYTEQYALQGRHPYDVSKSCTDLLSQTYHRTYGVPVAITRCGNIYGPGDYHLTRIVPDAMTSLLAGRRLLIRSDGTFTRDYIFVDDVVNGYLLVARQMKDMNLGGHAFNFSTESPISVLDLFRAIADMAGRRDQAPKVLNTATCEIPHQYLNARKARRMLRWKPRYSLEDGLREAYTWYSKAYKKLT